MFYMKSMKNQKQKNKKLVIEIMKLIKVLMKKIIMIKKFNVQKYQVDIVLVLQKDF